MSISVYLGGEVSVKFPDPQISYWAQISHCA